MMKKLFSILLLLVLALWPVMAEEVAFRPGAIWTDTDGSVINAHGGGILYYKGTYYWFGEYKDKRSNEALDGVSCYASNDLYHWKNEGIVLPVVKDNPRHDLAAGCIIERPKVIYNRKTKCFVMYFHHELKGRGYEAARVGVAVSKKPAGPYVFLKSYRPNAGCWPENMSEESRHLKPDTLGKLEGWTPDWLSLVNQGAFTVRDFAGGQMSRDMTLFVDEDGTAYHIYASEENLTLHIAELSEDYLSYTGKYIRVAPAGHNEAPAIFKKDSTYYMITSGCTGWNPNAARLLTANSIWGPWTYRGNPWQGAQAEISFDSQSTFILPLHGRTDASIFMADRWNPHHPSDGRYIWLPVLFEEGLPVLHWQNEWSLDIFE